MIINATIQQMCFLFSLILIGYVLVKLKLLPENAESVLSKLENYLFIPALVMNTFICNFTADKLINSAGLLIFSIILEAIVVLLSIFCTRVVTKDEYIRKIYLYGLCFSNFGFMGNAIVSSIFPEIFLEYIIFTLVLWALIYLWGVPVLLKDDNRNGNIFSRLKNLVNPMFICMIIGAVLGISQIKIPIFATTLIDSVGDCMSPVAMLITGMTIAKMDIKQVLKIKSIYIVSLLRLVIFPLLFIAICLLIKTELPQNMIICAVASLAMPLGLNTIVIPSAYGKDTSIASGMALISHILSIATIPLIFSLMPI